MFDGKKKKEDDDITEQEKLKVDQVMETLTPEERRWLGAAIRNRGETDSLDELVATAKKRVQQGEAIMQIAEKNFALYKLGEACEQMFLRYKLAMDIESRKAFRADEETYEAVSGVFFSAKSEAELDTYMDKTVAELVAISTQKRRAAQAAEEAPTT